MPQPFRVVSFNVENLFSRATVLNFEENADGKKPLETIEKLRVALSKKTYNKARIEELYAEVKEFIDIVEVREKLFRAGKVVADGVDDWGGFIEFKRDKFTEAARKNTARVLREVNADVCCLIEVESRPVLRHFCVSRLPRVDGSFDEYKYHMLLDGNDNRGIDVALASRIPIGGIWTHIYDRDADGPIFSRDCLELELLHPSGNTIWMLLNHLKSKGYGTQAANDAKRLRQAERIAEILTTDYDLAKDMVIVAGDMNETPDGGTIDPLLDLPNLHDVLEQSLPDPKDRWTYIYNRRGNQIDHLLVSTPLRERLVTSGIERRGMFGVDTFTNGAIIPFDTIRKHTDAASDHGAVWAEFNL